MPVDLAVEALSPAHRLAVLHALLGREDELRLATEPVQIVSDLLEFDIAVSTKMSDPSLHLRIHGPLSIERLCDALDEWGLSVCCNSAISDHLSLLEVTVAVDAAVRSVGLCQGHPYFSSPSSVDHAARMVGITTSLPVEEVILDLAACDLAYRLPLAGKFIGLYASQYQCRSNFWARQYVLTRDKRRAQERCRLLQDQYQAHLLDHRAEYAETFSCLAAATDACPSGLNHTDDLIAFAI